MERPLVSIIVLNYNGKHHLKACLDSLLKTDYSNFEILLVDNGSTDGSVEFVTQNYPQVRILRLKFNIGVGTGFMAGVLRSRGKYVALLNNDLEVDPKWLRPLVDVLEKLPKVAAADPKYRDFYHRERFDRTVAAGRWIDYFGNNYTRGVMEVDTGQYDRPVYIMGQTLYKRDILLKLGGFDPSYIFGYEDIDFGWRLYLAGYKAVFVPESIIYHKSGGTTTDPKEGRIKYSFYYLNKRNRLISLIKNYSIARMLISLPVTLLEYMGITVYYLAKGKPAYALGILKAIIYTIKNMKRIMVSRAMVQKLRTVSDKGVSRYMVKYSGDLLKILGLMR